MNVQGLPPAGIGIVTESVIVIETETENLDLIASAIAKLTVVAIGCEIESGADLGTAKSTGGMRGRTRLHWNSTGLQLLIHNRRSRSPFNRDMRPARPPMDRVSPPLGNRVASFRRSRSPSRRGGDRYQLYSRVSPRDSGPASAFNSQPVSRKASPGRGSSRARSPLPSRDQSPVQHQQQGNGAHRPPPFSREVSRPGPPGDGPGAGGVKSPPRGPAALRAPPTGPAAVRGIYGLSASSPGPPSMPRQPSGSIPQQQQQPQQQPRQDATSSSQPPSGPRGYVPPPRGGGYVPRGRGGWNQAPPRHGGIGPSPSPSTPSGPPSGIPTGPRVPSASALSANAAPLGGGANNSNNSGGGSAPPGRPFNPPTGPSASHGSGSRQTLAQGLMATMPPIIPGGKLDPSMTPLISGVSRELEAHTRKLRDEEEVLRRELYLKQERLRKNLAMWNRLDRESKAWELRSDLSERSMKNLAGEGSSGAAF